MCEGEESNDGEFLWIAGVGVSCVGSFLACLGLALQKRAHLQLTRTGGATKYYFNPLWLFGMLSIILDSILDVVSYGLAPQSLLAPLASLTVFYNVGTSACLLNEKIQKIDVAVSLILAFGTAIVIAFAPKCSPSYDLDALGSLWLKPAMVVFMTIVVLGLVALRVMQCIVGKTQDALLAAVVEGEDPEEPPVPVHTASPAFFSHALATSARHASVADLIRGNNSRGASLIPSFSSRELSTMRSLTSLSVANRLVVSTDNRIRRPASADHSQAHSWPRRPPAVGRQEERKKEENEEADANQLLVMMRGEEKNNKQVKGPLPRGNGAELDLREDLQATSLVVAMDRRVMRPGTSRRKGAKQELDPKEDLRATSLVIDLPSLSVETSKESPKCYMQSPDSITNDLANAVDGSPDERLKATLRRQRSVLAAAQALRELSKGRWAQAYRFSWPVMAGILGGQPFGNQFLTEKSVLYAKALVELLKTAIAGDGSAWGYFTPYGMLLALMLCLWAQLRFLNGGMLRFGQLFVVPVYQVSWILSSICSGSVFYEEFDSFTLDQTLMFICGVLVILGGISLLSTKRLSAA